MEGYFKASRALEQASPFQAISAARNGNLLSDLDCEAACRIPIYPV